MNSPTFNKILQSCMFVVNLIDEISHNSLLLEQNCIESIFPSMAPRSTNIIANWYMPLFGG